MKEQILKDPLPECNIGQSLQKGRASTKLITRNDHVPARKY